MAWRNNILYIKQGEPSGEAFVRFVSEQAVQMVLANKQSQTITSSTTGAQSTVQLSPATTAEMTDFITIPGSQPTFNWNTPGSFGAQFNPYQAFPGAAAIPTPLVMQLRKQV